MSLFYYPFSRDITNVTYAAEEIANQKDNDQLNRYFTPLVNVILNWRWLLPDWTVRIYVSAGHPYVRQLRKLGANVVEKDFDPQKWCFAMTWRFLAEDDDRFKYWVSRESESPPTLQDAVILRHWSAHTTYDLHAIHVEGSHQTVNGGLFGAKRGYISKHLNVSMEAALQQFSHRMNTERSFGSQYNDDQVFLGAIWRQIGGYSHGIAYESDRIRQLNRTFCNFRTCREYPSYPGVHNDTFRPSMNTIREDELILCHYQTEPFCRRTKYEGSRAWQILYELCTGEDFYTGKHVVRDGANQSGLVKCPYSINNDYLQAIINIAATEES